MYSTFLAPLRAGLLFGVIAANTLLHATPLLLLALVKLLLPSPALRRRLTLVLDALARNWVALNSWLIVHAAGTRVLVEGGDDLRRDGWYLVVSNHQSWVDIPILQQVFNGRIPLLKFFLKHELIWVPVLGLAWWALDFPFMRRYSRVQLEKHPEWRGKDMEATRRACAKFRELPVSVMNFVEGTRFTPLKHAQQASPYRHLLLPRAGGIAFVLQAMGPLLQALVDVSIAYPHGPPTLYHLLAGRLREVRVHIRSLPIPPQLLHGDYESDAAFRAEFQAWTQSLWQDKDVRMQQLLPGAEPS